MKSSPHFCRKDRNVGSLLIFLRFSLLHYYFNINLLRVCTIQPAAFVLCLLAWRIPRPLRLGDRKSVQAFHPLDGTPSLFAHPARALRALVLWGLLARNAGRPLTEAVPPCHFMTFPPPRGGIFLLSLRDISPTQWGNLPGPISAQAWRLSSRNVETDPLL